MKLEVKDNLLIVTREPGDKGFYRGGRNTWGSPESGLLHKVKKELNKPDCPLFSYPGRPRFIKKRMWKDGNMVDTDHQYIRTVKPVGKDHGQKMYLAIYNDHYAISDLGDDFNHGEAVLRVVFITVCKPQLSLRDPQRMNKHFQEVWDNML